MSRSAATFTFLSRPVLAFAAVSALVIPSLLAGVVIASSSEEDGARVTAIVTFASFARVPSDVQLASASLVADYRFHAIPALTVSGSASRIELLRADPALVSIEYDRPLQYHLDTATFSTNAADVWGSTWWPVPGEVARKDPSPLTVGEADTPIDGRGVVVGIVDSGVDATHPDLWYAPAAAGPLAPKVLACVMLPTMTTPEADSPNCDPASGHGTHVAGIVAGTGFSVRSGLTPLQPASKPYVGAAPGAQLAVAAAGAGLSIVYASQGLDWMYQHADAMGIRVVTNSWGDAPGCSATPAVNAITQISDRLVNDKQITVLYSAGNYDTISNPAVPIPTWTSTYSRNPTRGIISVANYNELNAGTRDGDVSTLSSDGCVGAGQNFLHTWPDVAAPGTAIASTAAKTGAAIAPTYDPGFYGSASGTSMSAPHVAGIVAMMYQAYPDITPAQVEEIIVKTSTPWSDTITARTIGGTTSHWGPTAANNAANGFTDPDACRVTPAIAARAEANDLTLDADWPGFRNLVQTKDLDASLFVCRDFKRGAGLVDAYAAVLAALELAGEDDDPEGTPKITIAQPTENAQVSDDVLEVSGLVDRLGDGVNEAPTATLAASATSGLAPLDVTFSMSASDADGVVSTYTLDFGDGATQSGAAVPASAGHTYAADGEYTATLTVTDNEGATAASAVDINVGGMPATNPDVAGTLHAYYTVSGTGAGLDPWVLTGIGLGLADQDNVVPFYTPGQAVNLEARSVTSTDPDVPVGLSTSAQWFFYDGSGAVVAGPLATTAADDADPVTAEPATAFSAGEFEIPVAWAGRYYMGLRIAGLQGAAFMTDRVSGGLAPIDVVGADGAPLPELPGAGDGVDEGRSIADADGDGTSPMGEVHWADVSTDADSVDVVMQIGLVPPSPEGGSPTLYSFFVNGREFESYLYGVAFGPRVYDATASVQVPDALTTWDRTNNRITMEIPRTYLATLGADCPCVGYVEAQAGPAFASGLGAHVTLDRAPDAGSVSLAAAWQPPMLPKLFEPGVAYGTESDPENTDPADDVTVQVLLAVDPVPVPAPWLDVRKVWVSRVDAEEFDVTLKVNDMGASPGGMSPEAGGLAGVSWNYGAELCLDNYAATYTATAGNYAGVGGVVCYRLGATNGLLGPAFNALSIQADGSGGCAVSGLLKSGAFNVAADTVTWTIYRSQANVATISASVQTCTTTPTTVGPTRGTTGAVDGTQLSRLVGTSGYRAAAGASATLPADNMDPAVARTYTFGAVATPLTVDAGAYTGTIGAPIALAPVIAGGAGGYACAWSGAGASFASASSCATTASFAAAGAYSVRVDVTDSASATAFDAAIVDVVSAASERVEVLVDGALSASAPVTTSQAIPTAPWSAQVDLSGVAAGPVTIVARWLEADGTVLATATRHVTLGGAGGAFVRIDAPLDGAQVSGTTAVSGVAGHAPAPEECLNAHGWPIGSGETGLRATTLSASILTPCAACEPRARGQIPAPVYNNVVDDVAEGNLASSAAWWLGPGSDADGLDGAWFDVSGYAGAAYVLDESLGVHVDIVFMDDQLGTTNLAWNDGPSMPKSGQVPAGANWAFAYVRRGDADTAANQWGAGPELTLTPNVVPPTIVQGLAALPGPGAVALSWSPPAVNGGELLGYKVYRDGAHLGSQTNPGFLDEPGDTATHLYEVAAYNSAGEGPRASVSAAANADVATFAITSPADGASGVSPATSVSGTYTPRGGDDDGGEGAFANTHYVYVLNLNDDCGSFLGYGDHVILEKLADHAVQYLGMPVENVHIYNENGGALSAAVDSANYGRLSAAMRSGALFDGPANWNARGAFPGIASEMQRIAALGADGEAAGGAPARVFFVESSHGILNPLILGDGLTDSSFCLQDVDVTSTMLGDLLNQIDADVAAEHPSVAIEWSINVDCSFCGGFADSPLTAPGTTAVATAGVVGPNRVVEVGCAWMTECTGNPAVTYHYMFELCTFTGQADGYGPRLQLGVDWNGADLGEEFLVGDPAHHAKDDVITLEEAYWCAMVKTHSSTDVFALEQEFQLVDQLATDMFALDGFVLWDASRTLGLGERDWDQALGLAELPRLRASAADPEGDSALPAGDLVQIEATATATDIVVKLTVADLTTSSAQLEDVIEYDLYINNARYGACYSLGNVYLFGYDIPNEGPTGEADPGAESAGTAVYDFEAGTILFTIPQAELPDATLPARVSGFSAMTECTLLALPVDLDVIPDVGTIATSADDGTVEPGADRVQVALTGPGAPINGIATLDEATGTWTFDPLGDLADGTWSVTAEHHFAADGTSFTLVDTATASFSVGGGADTQAPTAPTGLAVVGEPAATSVSLAWAAATDNVGVAGYDVFRDGVDVGDATGLSFTDTGLAPETAYTYTVKARDGAGNVGPASDAVEATTASQTEGAGTLTLRVGTTVLGSTSVDTSSVDPASWSVDIDTTQLADGIHTLVAEYDDGAGSLVVDSIQVSVANVVGIAIASPLDGASVSPTFTVGGTTSGTSGAGYEVHVRAPGVFDWAAATFDGAAFSFGVTSAPAGALTLEARLVRDGNPAALATDTIGVTVVAVNTPPVAQLVAAATADEGATVLLDGSGSSDADAGDTLAYVWTQLAGPSVALAGEGATRTFTAPQVNVDTDLRFRLSVTDAAGASDIDEAVVEVVDLTTLRIDTVDGAAAVDGVEAAGVVTLAGLAHVANSGSGGHVNQPPQANIQHTTSGATVMASSTGSFDADGTIVGRAWTLSREGLTVATGGAATFSYTATVTGTYVLTLSVTDNLGATGQAQTPAFALVATVVGGFAVDAGDSAFVKVGDMIPLTASAFGAQGAVSYAWSIGGQAVATGQSVLVSTGGMPAGPVEIAVQATDGASSATDTVKVLLYELDVTPAKFEEDVLVAVNDEDPGQISGEADTSGAVDGETYEYPVSISSTATRFTTFLTWENYDAIVPPNANNPLYPNGGGPSDFDLFVYSPDGSQDDNSADFDRPESLAVEDPQTGVWNVQVRSYLAVDDRFTLWVNVTQAPADPRPTATHVSGACYATSSQLLVGAVSAGASGAWDADNDGVFETSGLTATAFHPAGPGLKYARFRATLDGYTDTILVPFRVQASCAADPAIVVVAVSDTGVNAYSKEFEGAFVPDAALRALTTTDPANMGPGDVIKRDASGAMLPFTRHPSNYIPGFPASARALDLTLGAYNQGVDVAVWGTNNHAAIPLNTWFWVPGTKIVGAIDASDVAPVNGAADTIPIADEDGHGTGSASVAVGNTVGSCPRCLLVFAESLGGDVAFFDKPWIDFVSVSGGSLANVGQPDGGLFDFEGATRDATERGQTISYASGNGVENAFVTPEQTYTSHSLGPDWTIDVGAVHKGTGSATVGHGKPVDWVNYGSGSIPAACRNTYTANCNHSGTSSATPTATGHMANILVDVRTALGDALAGQKTTTQAGGIRQAVAVGAAIPASEWLADGVLQRAELWNAAFHCAVKMTSGSIGYPGTIPATPYSYLYEGYGLAGPAMESCARNVLLAGGPVPARAAEDAFFAIDRDIRVALWGDWDGDGDGAAGGDHNSLNAGVAPQAPALDVTKADVGSFGDALRVLRDAYASAGLAASGIPVSETYYLHQAGCGTTGDSTPYADRTPASGEEVGNGCGGVAAAEDTTWISRVVTAESFAAGAVVTAHVKAFTLAPMVDIVLTGTLSADGAPVGSGASAATDSVSLALVTTPCTDFVITFPTTAAIPAGATLSLRVTSPTGTGDIVVCYEGGTDASRFTVLGAGDDEEDPDVPVATIVAPEQGATLTGDAAAITGIATFPAAASTQKLYLRRDNCANLNTDTMYLSPTNGADAGNGCALTAGAAAPAQSFVERYPLVAGSLPVTLAQGGIVAGKIAIGTQGVDPARLQFTVTSSAGALGSVTKEATFYGANGYATLDWSIPVPDAIAGQSLSALGLEIRILQQGAPRHWTELENPASYIEIPRAVASSGTVQVAIDDPTFAAASLLAVTGDATWGASWSLVGVAPGEHVIYARAVRGTLVGPADSVGVTVESGETGTEGAGRVDVAFTQGVPGSADWKPAAFTPASGAWSYDWDTSLLPNGGWNAWARLVGDNGATLEQRSVVVSLVNERTPVIADIADMTVDENDLLAFAASASDLDGDALTYALDAGASGATLDAQTGAFSWTPSFTQAGLHQLTVTVTDHTSRSASDTFQVSVRDVNRAPTLAAVADADAAEGQTLAFALDGADADTDNTLRYAATGLPAGASVDEATGAFRWEIGFSDAGSYAATFTVSDGQATAERVATIVVANVNRAPVLAAVADRSLPEDSPLAIDVSATDADGTPLAFAATGLPGATVESTGPTSARISWFASYESAGAYTLDVTVSDGEAQDARAATITVANVNRAPVVSGAPGGFFVNVGQTVAFTASATDLDSEDTATMTIENVPAGATLDGGAFAWRPRADQAGAYTVYVNATDGEDTTRKTVSIFVSSLAQSAVNARTGIPYATLAAALLEAQAGDTIQLTPGTYPAAAVRLDGVTVCAADGAGCATAASEDVVIVGELDVSGDDVTLQGLNFTALGAGAASAIDADGAAGLRVLDSVFGPTTLQTIDVWGSPGTRVEGNRFLGTRDVVFEQSGSAGLVVRDNVFAGCNRCVRVEWSGGALVEANDFTVSGVDTVVDPAKPQVYGVQLSFADSVSRGNVYRAAPGTAGAIGLLLMDAPDARSEGDRFEIIDIGVAVMDSERSPTPATEGVVVRDATFLSVPHAMQVLTSTPVDARLNDWGVYQAALLPARVDNQGAAVVLQVPFRLADGSQEPPAPRNIGSASHTDSDPAECASLDSDGDGFADAYHDGTRCNYLTLGAAILAAHAGQTILVPASATTPPTARAESLVIDVNSEGEALDGLTLCGTSAAGTACEPGARADVLMDGSITLGAADVTLRGLTLRGAPAVHVVDDGAVLRENAFRTTRTVSAPGESVDARGNDWGTVGRDAIPQAWGATGEIRYMPYLDASGAYHPPLVDAHCQERADGSTGSVFRNTQQYLGLQDALDQHACPTGTPVVAVELGGDAEAYDGAAVTRTADIRGARDARILAPSFLEPGLTTVAGAGRVFVDGIGFQVGAGATGILVDGQAASDLTFLNEITVVGAAGGTGVLAQDGRAPSIGYSRFAGLNAAIKLVGTQDGLVYNNHIVDGAKTGAYAEASIVLQDADGARFWTNTIQTAVGDHPVVAIYGEDSDAPGLKGNVIRGNPAPSSIGIALRNVTGAIVDANLVTGANLGVYLANDRTPYSDQVSTGALVRGNRIVAGPTSASGGESMGVSAFLGGGHVIEDNTVLGAGVGVNVLGASDVTVEGLVTTATTGARVNGDGFGGAQPTGFAMRNSTLADAAVALHVGSRALALAIDAECNDWGVYHGAAIASRVRDEGAFTRLDYTPFTSLDGAGLGCLAMPVAAFTATPAAASKDRPVQFTDASTPGARPIVAWSWDFGDGQSSIEQSPEHAFAGYGTYLVALTVTDLDGLTSTFVDAIGVANHAPTLAAIADRTAPEGALVQLQLVGSDPDGDELAYAMSGAPTGATLDAATGAFSWQPSATQAGLHVIAFTASDGDLEASQTAAIDVRDVNHAPVLAAIGSRAVDEGDALAVALAASDTDGDILAFSATGLPAGAALDAATGALTWTPAFDAAGVYTTTLTVSDGVATDSETVTITVRDMQRAPVLEPIGGRAVLEGQALDFVVRASDPEGDAVRLFAVHAPPGASFTDDADGTGRFLWTPGYLQSGDWSVEFRASDGRALDTERVTLRVLDRADGPAFVPIDDLTTMEGGRVGFYVHAIDPDGSALTYGATKLPAGARFDGGMRRFDWTPSFAQSGAHEVVLTVSDGATTASESFLVSVQDVNRAPAGPAAVDVPAKANRTLSHKVPIADPDGDAVSFAASGLPAGAAFNATTGTLTWRPSVSQEAVHTVGILATDGAATTALTVRVHVSANAPPATTIVAPAAPQALSPATFQAIAVDPDGAAAPSVEWDFDAADGFAAQATGASATHTYPDAGTYVVVVKATDADGMTSYTARTVVVDDVLVMTVDVIGDSMGTSGSGLGVVTLRWTNGTAAVGEKVILNIAYEPTPGQKTTLRTVTAIIKADGTAGFVIPQDSAAGNLYGRHVVDGSVTVATSLGGDAETAGASDDYVVAL